MAKYFLRLLWVAAARHTGAPGSWLGMFPATAPTGAASKLRLRIFCGLGGSGWVTEIQTAEVIGNEMVEIFAGGSQAVGINLLTKLAVMCETSLVFLELFRYQEK